MRKRQLVEVLRQERVAQQKGEYDLNGISRLGKRAMKATPQSRQWRTFGQASCLLRGTTTPSPSMLRCGPKQPRAKWRRRMSSTAMILEGVTEGVETLESPWEGCHVREESAHREQGTTRAPE